MQLSTTECKPTAGWTLAQFSFFNFQLGVSYVLLYVRLFVTLFACLSDCVSVTSVIFVAMVTAEGSYFGFR